MGETTAGGLLWEALDDEGRKSQLIAMTKLAAERGRQLAEAEARNANVPDGFVGLVVEINMLRERLAAAQALLTTACDAWECGYKMWNEEGHLMADYKSACLPRAWYEKAKGGRDE